MFDVALDEPTDKDKTFLFCDYEIIIKKELAEKITRIDILYKNGISKSGFRVLTDLLWKYNYKNEDWSK